MTELDDMQEKAADRLWKVFLWALALLVGLTSYQLNRAIERLDSVDRRTTIIEASRCSAVDCTNLRISLAHLQSQLERFPTEIPPRWLVERVSKLEERIEGIERGHNKSH